MSEVNNELTAKKLFNLIKCFLNSNKYGEKISGQELLSIYQLSCIHELSPIIYHLIETKAVITDIENEKLTGAMKKNYRLALFSAVQQEESITEIKSAFRENSINVVFFKGAEIRNYYPLSQLRTMGDIDCLIAEKDRIKAHKILLDMGYICKYDTGNVYTYNKNSVQLEVHTKIAESNLGNGFDYDSYFSDAINNTEIRDNEPYLEKEYNLCFLIYHIAKHLSSTGAGIRMILDIAVFTKKFENEIDKERLYSMLREAKLYGTACAVFALCDKWFDTDFTEKFEFDKKIPDGLENYIINGGTFGFETHDTGDIYRRKALNPGNGNTKAPYRIKVLKDFFFPSSEYLERYLPASKKHKWLIPLAWLIRIFVGIFKRGRHSVSTLNSISKGDDDRTFKEAEMLRKMGI